LNELMDKAPAKVADGINPNEVPAGKKYWGLTITSMVFCC